LKKRGRGKGGRKEDQVRNREIQKGGTAEHAFQKKKTEVRKAKGEQKGERAETLQKIKENSKKACTEFGKQRRGAVLGNRSGV